MPSVFDPAAIGGLQALQNMQGAGYSPASNLTTNYSFSAKAPATSYNAAQLIRSTGGTT